METASVQTVTYLDTPFGTWQVLKVHPEVRGITVVDCKGFNTVYVENLYTTFYDHLGRMLRVYPDGREEWLKTSWNGSWR